MLTTSFKISDIIIFYHKKDIKSIYLSVNPPNGKVIVTAPLRLDLETIKAFALSKLSWIKQQQRNFLAQDRETPKKFLTRESHFYNGIRYLLNVIEENAPPKVVLRHRTIDLYIRANTSQEKRKEIFENWYQEQLKKEVSILIEKWQFKMKVLVNDFDVKKMRTKWGTCNTQEKSICINLEMAKKPPHCLEYIVVRSMLPLLKQNNKELSQNYLDIFLPRWRFYKQELAELPIPEFSSISRKFEIIEAETSPTDAELLDFAMLEMARQLTRKK